MKSMYIWIATARLKYICVCMYIYEYLVDIQIKLANRRD